MKKSIKNYSANKNLATLTDTVKTDISCDSKFTEAEKDKIAFDATQEFLNSGIEIKDVFGNLEENLIKLKLVI